MKIIILLLEVFLTIAVIHLISILVFNLLINPYDPSTFTKIFPYQFLYNLIFSKQKTKKAYFFLRLDINTSKDNVKKNNAGVAELIRKADEHNIPITFSIASEYIPALSEEVKELIDQPQHEVISHSHIHSDITKQNQSEQLRKSKHRLENTFEKNIKGMVAPNAKHDKATLKAAKKNEIRYISAGSLGHIRYWSFPYPFKKNNIWLLGGDIPSDHYLYRQKNKSPKEALEIWKKAINHRAKKGWFSQLEYHNFSTSKEELKVLEEIFKHIQKKHLESITQIELIDALD
ncbi:MAG: polysaccharide deacetylase family protein [Candidatus Natronoplasma sp.]